MPETVEIKPEAVPAPAPVTGGMDAETAATLLRVAFDLGATGGPHPEAIRRAVARRRRLAKGEDRPTLRHRRGTRAATLAAIRLSRAGFAVRIPMVGDRKRMPKIRQEQRFVDAMEILRRADEGISPERQREMRLEMERELDSHRPPGQKLFS